MWCAVQIYHANTLCWVNIAKIQHVQLYPVFSPVLPVFFSQNCWVTGSKRSQKAVKLNKKKICQAFAAFMLLF